MVGSAMLIGQHVVQASEEIQDLLRALLLHLYARGLNTRSMYLVVVHLMFILL